MTQSFSEKHKHALLYALSQSSIQHIDWNHTALKQYATEKFVQFSLFPNTCLFSCRIGKSEESPIGDFDAVWGLVSPELFAVGRI